MIPKTIHYCWLSGDPFPETIAKCMATWKTQLPDYEFILWDTKRFDLESSLWVKQAFETKKYAFAADYIRLYAVYHFGGIYMDTDVEVVKPFDDLLSLPYFVGSEGGGIIEAGVFGAQKGMPWLKDCLSYYDNKAFIKPDGTPDTWTLPRIMMASIEKNRTVIELPKAQIMQKLTQDIPGQLLMFPPDFFCAKNHGTGVVYKNENTYSIHHFAMSWISKKHTFFPNLKRKLMKFFGVGFISGLIRFFRLREIRATFRKS
jgi:hypothetical protein